MLRTLLIVKLFLLSMHFSVMAKEVNAEKAEKTGNLVIAGGAISHLSTDIFTRFTELSGGKHARIGIVPAATGSIDKQFKLLLKSFLEAGGAPNNVILLPLAVKDDKNTEQDESQWLTNGNATQVAEQIASLTGVWFIGGDQTLITQTLLNEDGTDTLALQQLRKIYQSGATLGGTSAGAAIMSQIMISGGNSQGALFQGFKSQYTSMDEQEYGPVVTAPGLGFMTQGIIDQHFDRKGRLGRLIVTLLNDENYNWGYGVDEGTAMLVEGQQFTVIGEGGVTVVDTQHVTGYVAGQFPVAADNIRLSYVQVGDSFDMASGQLTVAEEASATRSHEYFNVPQQNVSGLVNANRNLDEFLGYNLLDNKATNQVLSWLIAEPLAIHLVFTQDQLSKGYWRTDVTADVYSFENVRMDIRPANINFSE